MKKRLYAQDHTSQAQGFGSPQMHAMGAPGGGLGSSGGVGQPQPVGVAPLSPMFRPASGGSPMMQAQPNKAFQPLQPLQPLQPTHPGTTPQMSAPQPTAGGAPSAAPLSPFMQPTNQRAPPSALGGYDQATGSSHPAAAPPPSASHDDGTTSPPGGHAHGAGRRRVYPVDEEGNFTQEHYEGQDSSIASSMGNMRLSDSSGAPGGQPQYNTQQQGHQYQTNPAGAPQQGGYGGGVPQQHGAPGYSATPAVPMYAQQQPGGYGTQQQQPAGYGNQQQPAGYGNQQQPGYYGGQQQQQPAYGQQQQQQQQYPQQTQQQQQQPHPQSPTPAVTMVEPTAANQCPRRFMRFTVNAIPATQALLTKSSIPLGCVIEPLAPQEGEDHVPVVNFGASGIVRCRRCRTYINPFVAFTDGGRRWRCNVCELPNDVPAEYYAQVDPSTGKRLDIHDRPELQRGCVEFIAPSEYMIRPPQPPVYFFLIDVCYAAVSSGMFHSVVQAIKETLDDLPGDSRTQVGFITFDRMLHFYNLRASLTQPQMMVVPDIENVFIPLADDLLVNLGESRRIVDALLDKLPSMFAHTQQVESAFGPALKAAFSVIKHIGGKLLVFQSNMPLLGPGKLANREDPKLAAEKDYTLVTPMEPAASFYKDFALDCSRQYIGVDLFLFPSAFIDVGTLGVLPQITGGQLYSYPGFHADKQGETVIADVRRNLSRYTSWEAVMRVRCSRGVKVTAHHGNFFIRSTDLLAIPNADEDKGYAVQLGISENISNVKYSCIQTALLYTTSSGERRIRVLTSCLPVVSNVGDIFKYADVGAITNLIAKMAIDKVQTTKISDAREAVVNKCIEILVAYKDSFTSATSAPNTQLAVPDSLQPLPLYVLALAKNILFRPTDVRPDERAFHMYRFKTLGVDRSLAWIYPRLYNLSMLPEDVGRANSDGHLVLPATLNLSSEKIDRRSLFLLDTGFSLVVFVPKGVAPEMLRDAFGVDRFEAIPPGVTAMPAIESRINTQIRSLIAALRSLHHQFLRVDIVREGDPTEYQFTLALIEDRTRSVSSYYEFMTQLQRSVQSKSSR